MQPNDLKSALTLIWNQNLRAPRAPPARAKHRTTMAATTSETLHFVSTSSALRADGSRVHARLAGRQVSVVRCGTTLHALDTICYHAGGNLMVGDIEEVGGLTCISCPLHGYKLTLATGEKLYKAVEKGPSGKLEPAGWRSAGKRQRVHHVIERGGDVFVRLDDSPEPLESDKYAMREREGLASTHGARTR